MHVIGSLMEIIKKHFDSEVKFYNDGSQVLVHMMDMAKILMLPKTSRDVIALVWAEYRFQLANGVGKPAWYVTEPGLYQLIFASNHTKAVEIQRWVFEEVLPSIRKDGFYVAKDLNPEQEEAFIEKAAQIKLTRENRLQARLAWTDVIKERLVVQGKYDSSKSQVFAQLTKTINIHLFGVAHFNGNRDTMTVEQQNAMITFETLLTKQAIENPGMDAKSLVVHTLTLI